MEPSKQGEYDNEKLIELFDIVNHSEKVFPVWDWQIRGVSVWPIISIRFLALASHHFHTQRFKLSFGPRTLKRRVSAALRIAVRRCKSLVRDILFFVQRQKTLHAGIDFSGGNLEQSSAEFEIPSGFPLDLEVLFLSNTTAGYMFDDIGIQQVVDSFRIAEEKDKKKTATFVVGAYDDTELIIRNWLNQNYPFGPIQNLINTQASKFKTDVRKNLSQFSEWEDYICAKGDLIDLKLDVYFNREINSTLAYIEYFRFLFGRCSNLKKVYQVCYYGPIGYALNYVCRERGIPCIELQHGVQGKHHRPYYFGNLPTKAVGVLPTEFFNWTQQDSESILSWARPVGIKSKIVGLTWNLFLKSTENEDLLSLPVVKFGKEIRETILSWRKERDRITESAGSEKIILFTTHNGEQVEWLNSLFTLCREKNYFVWWRIHPGELSKPGRIDEAEEACRGFPVNVRLASKIPLPFLLERSDVHLTKFSSTTIEANANGIPTITYSKQGLMFFGDLSGGAGLHYASEFSEIALHLSKIPRKMRLDDKAESRTLPIEQFKASETKQLI